MKGESATMREYNRAFLELFEIETIKPELIPYFNYYASKYAPELLGDSLIITISVWYGCRSLDTYFIDILTANGWNYSEYALLHQIYITKPLKAIKTA